MRERIGKQRTVLDGAQTPYAEDLTTSDLRSLMARPEHNQDARKDQRTRSTQVGAR